ncbi:MAG: histidine kinase, partial [Flavobacteriaceae bacterium]|nr:histidine kinase [Flavobacteriaceae bacterium]
MILNKEKRIQYLGFNDIGFMIVGILLLSVIIDYIFNNSFANFEFKHALMNWSISLFFTICNWFIVRSFIISLRKKYPDFKHDIKRILLLLLIIISTVILVDFSGNQVLIRLFPGRYNSISSPTVLMPIIIVSIMTNAIYEAIYHYVRLKKSILEKEQAKQAIVQAQLDALRNQAQPHFLFNSLNTLRDIIEENSKEQAKEFVDKLSDVYRYLLDSGNANLIELADEL